MSLLMVTDLKAFYGDFQALFGIDFEIAEGEAVAVIGSNGAGKSTFLKAITGLLPAPPEAVIFDDEPIGSLPAYEIVGKGLAMVPEGRQLFPSLSVEENLLLGGYSGRNGPWMLERIYDLFPVLGERRNIPSTALSGGEQQMAAIGRALMSNPRLILCDEISLGLAPVVIKGIYDALPGIMAEGASVLVVEQDIGQAMKVADRIYCFQEGRVSLESKPELLTREQIAAAYFGV
ncbi:MAG: ABC transporter ATP-binding protein [Alphaproteobacteria bacterium]|nr:ABC transporter ATP-binding protein [Alphaproteobacteria bacterium]